MSNRRQESISGGNPTRTAQAFRVKAKSALVRRNESVTSLARTLGRNRSSVSQAINQGRFPLLRAKITEALAL